MPWNDRGRQAAAAQVRRVLDAQNRYGKDSEEAKAEQAKFKAISRNPRHQAK